jgi:hypothetical protein
VEVFEVEVFEVNFHTPQISKWGAGNAPNVQEEDHKTPIYNEI